jgi:hypothetical protein
MPCSQGSQSRLLIEGGASPHVFDASSELYDFLYEDISKQGNLVGGKGIAGTRSNYANRIREGSYLIGGKLSTYTCPKDLDLWLPRILGAAEVNDVFALDDALLPFGMLIDRVAGVFKYSNCYIDKAIWRCEAGPGDGEPELVEQVLIIQAMAEDSTAAWPVSPPALSVAANRNPYITADGILTIGSTGYVFHDFVIVVDNHLSPRWVNSLTPTALCPQDRTVMLRVTFPFTVAADAVLSGIYQNANRHTGVTATIVMTSTGAACSTTWTFTGLQWAQVSPTVPGKRDIRLTVDFVARKTGSAQELVVTNDSVVT